MKTLKIRTVKKLTRTKVGRNARGTSLIELGAVAFLMPLIAILCINICVGVFAAGIVDGACKDAARAAGQRTNEDDALYAAKAVLKRYTQTSGAFLGQPELTVTYDTKAASPGDPPNIDLGPDATVTLAAVVQLPAPIVFNGQTLTDKINFKSSYSFPILSPGASSTGEMETTENPPNLGDAQANKYTELIDGVQDKIENDAEQAYLAESNTATEQVIYTTLANPADPLEVAVLNAQNAYNDAFDPTATVNTGKAEFADLTKALGASNNAEAKELLRLTKLQRTADLLVVTDQKNLDKYVAKLEGIYDKEAAATQQPPVEFSLNGDDGTQPSSSQLDIPMPDPPMTDG